MAMVLIIIASLALLGLGLVITGVFMLAGLAWALLALGLALCGVAAILRRGLTSNG